MISRRMFTKTIGTGVLGAILPSATLADGNVAAKAPPDPKYLSATEMASAIRNGKLSSVELVQACLDQIQSVNKELNAVVQLRAANAMMDAAKADTALSKGLDHVPRHGVPFTIKDSFDTFDLISTAGTRGRINFTPARDATVVRRLRQAGGILLGKTNLPELTLGGETNNPVYGRTNNPLDLRRTPGGSSGGAAAIIAAMGSPLDIGSDTGGSVRWPAHCCGIHGFKPSSGRVPRTGHIVSFVGELESLTQPGPLARSVDDLILAMKIIAGEDGIDPHIVSMPFDGLDRTDVRNLRVAYYTDNRVMHPTSDTVTVMESAFAALQKGGARITRVLPERITAGHQLMVDIILSDFHWVEAVLAEAGTKDSPLLEFLAAFPTSEQRRPMARLIEDWDRYRSWMLQFMDQFDVIICPVAPITAPLHGGFTMESGSYLTVYNLAGWPASSINVGTSSENLPINIQVVGRPWADGLVLSVSRWLVQMLSA